MWPRKVSEGEIVSLGTAIHTQLEKDNLRRMGKVMNGYAVWLDGQTYPTKSDKSLFGRVSAYFTEWGEMRRQKKAPHTEVLYVYCLQDQKARLPGSGGTVQANELVLRSINNCSNDQLQDAIKLVALRLEQHKITQLQAETLLDLCYAEIQRRLAWTESEKAKRNGRKQPQEAQGNPIVEGSSQS